MVDYSNALSLQSSDADAPLIPSALSCSPQLPFPRSPYRLVRCIHTMVAKFSPLCADAAVPPPVLSATTPAGSVGAVTVTMTVNGQAGSLTNGFTYNSAVAISFGQVAAATPQSPTATVPVTFPGAQTAGDLNIVVVG